jgi:hypothetical protein
MLSGAVLSLISASLLEPESPDRGERMPNYFPIEASCHAGHHREVEPVRPGEVHAGGATARPPSGGGCERAVRAQSGLVGQGGEQVQPVVDAGRVGVEQRRLRAEEREVPLRHAPVPLVGERGERRHRGVEKAGAVAVARQQAVLLQRSGQPHEVPVEVGLTQCAVERGQVPSHQAEQHRVGSRPAQPLDEPVEVGVHLP